jgi:hypothetical protein
MDINGNIMQNGLYENCPDGNILADYYGQSSLFDQTSIIIPKKGNQYYVFSTGMSDSVATQYLNHIYAEFDVLNYSIVDMDSNGGLGAVTIKNKILADNQHYVNCALTAVRHGNGQDWWLVKADCRNDRFQLYQVTSDTILGPYYQSTNFNGDSCAFFSQIYFSDDGTKMASSSYMTNRINATNNQTYIDPNQVELYDFDRCTGTLTFNKHYEVPLDTATIGFDFRAGICFSPDASKLYTSNNYTIYQIDLQDTSINNTIFISGPDTVLSDFPLYNTMACAPNGKLYIGNWNGTRKYMSYIDKPNNKGLLCDFRANGVWQPYTNLLSPPNMPNYGLEGNGLCWPTSTNDEFSMLNDELSVYPNPASSIINLELRITNWGSKKREIELYNSIGQLVYQKPITKLSNQQIIKLEIDVSQFPKGLYYIRVGSITKKVVVD